MLYEVSGDFVKHLRESAVWCKVTADPRFSLLKNVLLHKSATPGRTASGRATKASFIFSGLAHYKNHIHPENPKNLRAILVGVHSRFTFHD
jgi:hypothetical protein